MHKNPSQSGQSASTDAVNQKPRERSFASLNFLRGLSAAAVLVSHTAYHVSNGQPILAFNWGGLAVDVFMLISGFLMMWHFYERQAVGETWGAPQTCLKFYIRRFFRIAPLYYSLLILFYVFYNGLSHLAAQNQLVFQPPYTPGPNDPTSTTPTIGHILAHFSFAFGFIPRFAASTAMPDWSIGLEMQFYLFFPFIAIFLVRSQFIWGAVVLLASKLVALQLFGLGVGAEPKVFGLFPYATLLPFKIDCFLVGILIAAALYERDSLAKRAFLLLLGLLVAAFYTKKFALICFVFITYELATTYGTGLPPFDRLVKKTSRIIEHRLFRFMADASYGVYLIHMPLLVLVVWALTHVSHFAQLSPKLRLLVGLAVITPIVYSLAFLAFKYIESPGIKWGRTILKKIKPATP